MTTSATVNDTYERMIQIYDWRKTARLNVLYYEESFRNWTWAVRGHDTVIALTGASSPIAFWQYSSVQSGRQFWFYLTLIAGLLAILKPILRWDKQLVLFTELRTRYRDVDMDLKCLCEDITATKELTSKLNARFEHYRETFKTLGHNEPVQIDHKVLRLQKKVNEEININNCWFPPTEGE